MSRKDGKGLPLMESKAATIILPLPWSTASPERGKNLYFSEKKQGSNLETGYFLSWGLFLNNWSESGF